MQLSAFASPTAVAEELIYGFPRAGREVAVGHTPLKMRVKLLIFLAQQILRAH